MSLPTMSGIGRATADPELRFAASGTAVCKVNLAFNSRKRQDDGTWVDDKVFFVEGVCFKQMAESLAENVTRGTELVVSGRLTTEQWEDKNDGGKRSKTSLLIDSIGPAISNFQSAKPIKMDRASAGSAPRGGSDADPWASATPAASRGSSFDDQSIPF